jgi:hypothetical protein
VIRSIGQKLHTRINTIVRHFREPIDFFLVLTPANHLVDVVQNINNELFILVHFYLMRVFFARKRPPENPQVNQHHHIRSDEPAT